MRRRPQVLTEPLQDPVTRGVPMRMRKNDATTGSSGFRHLAFGAALAGSLLACKTADEAPAPKSAPGVVARLASQGGGGVTFGSASFQPVEGGVVATVDLQSGTGGRWRTVIHATGNCTSPNLFSAGPPLLLPGFSAPIEIPIVTTGDTSGSATVRIAGLAIGGPTGIIGKSVVVHAGAAGPLDAQPGVPNNRVACGVIETARPLF
jgi:Cu-Zn family superoxide dismutase